MAFIIILAIVLIIIACKDRSKKESVINHSLEETKQITQNHLIKDAVIFVVGVIMLFTGISKYNSNSGALREIGGFFEAAIGGIIGLIYLIAALSNLSKLGEYSNMNQIQYKQHQEKTSQQIKTEDEQARKAMQRRMISQGIKNLFGGW